MPSQGRGQGRGAGQAHFHCFQLFFSPQAFCWSFGFVERAWGWEGGGFSFLASGRESSEGVPRPEFVVSSSVPSLTVFHDD